MKTSVEFKVKEKRLGKAAARSHPKQLFLSDYLKKAVKVPETYNYWGKRTPFPIRDIGNNEYGNCTIASQVLLSQRMERLEQIKTVAIPKDNIISTYLNMTERLYGGGDTGAYEMDALNNFRNKDLTFRDSKGRPYTIDAFVRINQANIEEVKQTIFLSGAQGIKVCFNLPIAWADTNIWDIPEGQQPVGKYMPGSWGGHSMMATARWDKNYLWLPSSWNQPDGKISWNAFSIYCDEAYLCVDSVNAWKKKPIAKVIDLPKLVSDVNNVSSIKLVA